ncbi:hypothetical protein VP01_7060g1, partial [Puccinia sorghi]
AAEARTQTRDVSGNFLAKLSRKSFIHFTLVINTSNTPVPSKFPRIHSLSGTCQNLNTVTNNQWSPSHGATSAIQSAKLVGLYNRTGTSSSIQNSAHVKLSIRDISFSAVSTSGPIQEIKTPRDRSFYQGYLKEGHKAGMLGEKIGYFSATHTDAEMPSSPSESSQHTLSNPSSPGPGCSGESACLSLDKSFDQPSLKCFQLHLEDVDSWMGSHSLSKFNRQAQESELHTGLTSALHARKAIRWNHKIQCELTPQRPVSVWHCLDQHPSLTQLTHIWDVGECHSHRGSG